MLLMHYRWIFIALACVSIAAGFYLNYLRTRSRWPMQTIFWLSTAFTVASLIHWGWWRLL